MEKKILSISDKVDLLIKNSGTPEMAIAYLVGFMELQDSELNRLKDHLGLATRDNVKNMFDSIEAKHA
jgi:hypothetical protein